MYPLYERTNNNISVALKKSKHVPPHLHNAIELVYVTEGALEFGLGEELYHMEAGDFAIAFPDVIHHYQVLSRGINKAVYILAEPALFGMFSEKLQKNCPVNPVIKKQNLHADVVSAIEALLKSETCSSIVKQTYIQLILAHIF